MKDKSYFDVKIFPLFDDSAKESKVSFTRDPFNPAGNFFATLLSINEKQRGFNIF